MASKEIDREAVLRIALQNATRYEGKAQFQAVLGRFLAENPHLRSEIKNITPVLNDVINGVNRLSLEEQRRILQEKWPTIEEEEAEEEKRELPPLANIDKYEEVVTRFSPNPDCVLHLGSARAIILSYRYAKLYGGKFFLRFEDTDPRLKRSALQFYDLIREDLVWLGCKWDKEFIQSNRISVYYDYAERGLQKGFAYVCLCEREVFRKRTNENQACPCRDLPLETQLKRWKRMLDGSLNEGEAVVRIKTDLDHPNPAVREWPALRIINQKKYPHPRIGDKYRVWPLYNFACGIDDHLMKVTHIIRGKEHLTNQVRQEYLYRHFGWNYPETIHYGRLKITGASLSKSQILKGVREGVYKSWDDPRLATFAALRRRGIKPESIHQLIIEIGPKKVDLTLSWDNLYAYNRKKIDPVAERYFFVSNPTEIEVKHVPKDFRIKIPLHPDHKEWGYRQFKVDSKKGVSVFLISKKDVKTLDERKRIRFMELFNIELERLSEDGIKAIYHSESYEVAKNFKLPLIHWIPIDTGIPCEVVMPNATIVKGIAEEESRNIEKGEIVQFERFGFIHINDTNEKIDASFAHR